MLSDSDGDLAQPVAAGATDRVQHHDGHGNDADSDGVQHDGLFRQRGVELIPAHHRMPPLVSLAIKSKGEPGFNTIDKVSIE